MDQRDERRVAVVSIARSEATFTVELPERAVRALSPKPGRSRTVNRFRARPLISQDRTPQAASPTASGLKKVDIEQLLSWAFIDELPKRQISSAEGIWDRMARYGSLGGVNPDTSHFAGGGAQRYAQFGLPHPDAEAIEKAVGALGSTAVDWDAHFEAIAGELSGLVDISGSNRRSRYRAGAPDSGFVFCQLHERTQLSEFTYVSRARGGFRRGLRTRNLDRGPRDVIAVASINLTALVTTHAVKRSRPFWQHDAPQPSGRSAGRGFEVIGECRGHNLYTAGSYCPLTWSPSPLQIVLDRADYFLWHQALTTLSETLDLSGHEATKPAASAAPWRDGEIAHRTYKQEPDRAAFSLRDVERPRAGPTLKIPKFSKVRYPLLDEGE